MPSRFASQDPVVWFGFVLSCDLLSVFLFFLLFFPKKRIGIGDLNLALVDSFSCVHSFDKGVPAVSLFCPYDVG